MEVVKIVEVISPPTGGLVPGVVKDPDVVADPGTVVVAPLSVPVTMLEPPVAS